MLSNGSEFVLYVKVEPPQSIVLAGERNPRRFQCYGEIFYVLWQPQRPLPALAGGPFSHNQRNRNGAPMK